jgi:hypothetical protein
MLHDSADGVNRVLEFRGLLPAPRVSFYAEAIRSWRLSGYDVLPIFSSGNSVRNSA